MRMPGPITRARTAIARFRMRWDRSTTGVTAFDSLTGFASTTLNHMMGALPGSQWNWAREVGDPCQNGAVSICLNWIGEQFPEPEFGVERRSTDQKKKWEREEGHPLVDLLANPNPYYGPYALWGATVASFCVSGNAYWIKARGMGGTGQPINLWHVPYWQIRPRWEDGSSFVDYYEYQVDGRIYRLSTNDVVHFRDKIENRTRLGVSRIWPVLREVCTDNEASVYQYALLKNMGIPGVILSPLDPNVPVGPTAREDLAVLWSSSFTGDGRGKPLIPSVPIRVEKLGLSPQEMALTSYRDLPEDRICAALRVPAMVVGLSSGSRHKTYANYEEARKAAYQDCIVPLQKQLAEALNRQLLPDFGEESHDQLRAAWFYDNVQCLQEDVAQKAARVRDDWLAGIITRGEARASGGYEVDDARDDVFNADVHTVEKDKPNPVPTPTMPGTGPESASGMKTPNATE